MSWGTVSTMITSLKNNALPIRDRLFDKKNSYSNLKLKIDKKATKEQIEQTRLRIRNENRIITLKRITALGVAILIVILLFRLIF